MLHNIRFVGHKANYSFNSEVSERQPSPSLHSTMKSTSIAIILSLTVSACILTAHAEPSYRGTASTNGACPAGNIRVSCGPGVWGCFPDGSPSVCCSCDIDDNRCLGCRSSNNCPGDLDPDSYCISSGLSTALLIIAIVIPILVVAVVIFVIVLCCCCLARAAAEAGHRNHSSDEVIVVHNPPLPPETQVIYGPDGTAYVQQPQQKAYKY